MQIGFIVNHLGATDLAFYILNEINSAIDDEVDHDFYLFTEELVKPCIQPLCSIMNISEISSFNGLTIATDLNTAHCLAKAVNAAKKVFYVWDLEFLRPNKQNFQYNIGAYRNPELTLVCRSQSHAKLLSQYANRSIDCIIEHANIEQLVELGLNHEFFREAQELLNY